MPPYIPCEECGEPLDDATAGDHRCDPARWAEYQALRVYYDVGGFEAKWQRYLAGAHGRFEVWLAARRVGGRR